MWWIKRLLPVVIFFLFLFSKTVQTVEAGCGAGYSCTSKTVIDILSCRATSWDQYGDPTGCESTPSNLVESNHEYDCTNQVSCQTDAGVCSSNDTCTFNALTKSCDCSNSQGNCCVLDTNPTATSVPPPPTATPTNTPTPTPTPYPTVAVSGNLREYLGAACYNNISTNTLSINLNPQSPAGVTTNCGVTPPTGQTKSSYRCTAVFNNQSAAPTPAQNLNLSASATGYSSAYWTAANACTATANNSLPVDVSSGGSTVYSKDIFFKNISSWIKLKNSSFRGISYLTNYIPLSVTAYDSEDECLSCPNGLRYFIINSAGNDPGVVTASSINTGTADVSSKGWKADYTQATAFTPLSFTQYVKARKQHTTITSLDQINADDIYIYQGALTLNNSNLNQATASKFVLIVDGDVIIDQDKFNIGNDCIDTSTSKKIAILSKTGTITFSNTTQCAEGIFIAQIINTDSTSNQGLKIKGNLIAQSTLNNSRSWSDNSKPSVFIIFDPTQYINLLPYLSTVNYEWRQIQ